MHVSKIHTDDIPELGQRRGTGVQLKREATVQ